MLNGIHFAWTSKCWSCFYKQPHYLDLYSICLSYNTVDSLVMMTAAIWNWLIRLNLFHGNVIKRIHEIFHLDYVTHCGGNYRRTKQTTKCRQWKCRHFAEIFITGYTKSCHLDNFQCSLWWKFHQNDAIFISVNDKSVRSRAINFNEIWVEIVMYSFYKMHNFNMLLATNISHVCLAWGVLISWPPP